MGTPISYSIPKIRILNSPLYFNKMVRISGLEIPGPFLVVRLMGAKGTFHSKLLLPRNHFKTKKGPFGKPKFPFHQRGPILKLLSFSLSSKKGFKISPLLCFPFKFFFHFFFQPFPPPRFSKHLFGVPRNFHSPLKWWAPIWGPTWWASRAMRTSFSPKI